MNNYDIKKYCDGFNDPPEVKAEVAEFLRKKVPVTIYQNSDLGDTLWAVSTEDCYWLGAWETEEEARKFVELFELPLIED